MIFYNTLYSFSNTHNKAANPISLGNKQITINN
jgi:hypothetical protein